MNMVQKYPKEELKIRYNIYENLQNLYERLNDDENGGNAAPKQQYQTLTDMKASIIIDYFGEVLLFLFVQIFLGMAEERKISIEPI